MVRDEGIDDNPFDFETVKRNIRGTQRLQKQN